MVVILEAALILFLSFGLQAEEIPYPAFKEPFSIDWDKPLHFAAGALANEVGGVAYEAITDALEAKKDPLGKAVAGMLAALAAGAAKEYLDSQEKGNKWDNKDLAATVAGALPAFGIRISKKF